MKTLDSLQYPGPRPQRVGVDFADANGGTSTAISDPTNAAVRAQTDSGRSDGEYRNRQPAVTPAGDEEDQ